MFAFSTALAWSYYGDRAIVYLIGTRWVLPYRICYVLGFFSGHHCRHQFSLADIRNYHRFDDLA